MKKKSPDPDMLDEYDFSQGVRGKCAKRYAEGANVVVIEPDVAEYFPDHDSVNEALRGLIAIVEKAIPAQQDEPRAEYKRSDFSGPLVRGKYAKLPQESSNIVVLRPEVAEVFPNEEAVNTALMSLIKLARSTTRWAKRSSSRSKSRAT